MLKFNNINKNIKIELTALINIYKDCKNRLTNEDLDIITEINNHKLNFRPLNFIINNNILLFLIKDMIFV